MKLDTLILFAYIQVVPFKSKHESNKLAVSVEDKKKS